MTRYRVLFVFLLVVDLNIKVVLRKLEILRSVPAGF